MSKTSRITPKAADEAVFDLGETALWLAVRDPRGFVAWRLHKTAMPLLRAARRLCDDVPSDFHEEWEDGRQYGERTALERAGDLVWTAHEAGVEAGLRAARAGTR